MLKAHADRVELEASAGCRTPTRDAATEKARRIRRAQRLTSSALYGKAAKALAQTPALDASSAVVQAKLRSLHFDPAIPVDAFSARDVPLKTSINLSTVLGRYD
eukprot:Plantae.Rhodophyta-Palmaria_palmata.ctg16193.p1 GENE.Plantae.Rhodophyta-Palmaria_palmata.ctg16193~~Plantae.Rhodophyta-Palmaria_palmata.ctg16193.p1  ORF type:complete len:104 (+),score=9.45 Plantae.Rhodophyta-Palmaria_palmata.ctg16193:184-495(+)